MGPTRVLLVDDHSILRAGLASLLRNIEGVEVVAQAGDGIEALELVEAHRPDVVLTDIAMPRMSGLALATRLAETHPEIRVVILSMHADEEYVSEALRVGAAGYLLKDSDTSELEQAFHALTRGQTYLSPGVSPQVMAAYQKAAKGVGSPDDPLSPRQREVLRLIAEGHTTKAIARALGVSVKTVESHRAQLMDRLDIHDVASLVRYAIRIGLIGPV